MTFGLENQWTLISILPGRVPQADNIASKFGWIESHNSTPEGFNAPWKAVAIAAAQTGTANTMDGRRIRIPRRASSCANSSALPSSLS